MPAIHKELGAFVALIVANCLILGRQEAFASRNTPGLAVMDALGMSAGFAFALLALGAVREILGNGSLFGVSLFGPDFEPWIIMILPPGDFSPSGFCCSSSTGSSKSWSLESSRIGNPGKGGLKDETEHPFDEESLDQQNEIGQENGSERMRNDAC